jgi:hypothetical protein
LNYFSYIYIINQNKKKMKSFAITDGQTLFPLAKATNPKEAVGIMIKIIMRDEYEIKPNAEGKIVTKENLQSCYEDWAETAIENMQNDGYAPGNYTVSLEEMTDNWSNRYWIVAKEDHETVWSQAVDNSDMYKLINDRISPLVTEKSYTIAKQEA